MITSKIRKSSAIGLNNWFVGLKSIILPGIINCGLKPAVNKLYGRLGFSPTIKKLISLGFSQNKLIYK